MLFIVMACCIVPRIDNSAEAQERANPEKQEPPKHRQPGKSAPTTGAKQGARKMSDNKLTGGKVTFTTSTGQIVVTPHELEQMRQSVLAYLQQHEPSQHTELSEELKQAHGFIVDNRTAYVGGWRLEQRDQQLRLKRYPAERTPVTLLPYAVLSPHGDHWRVDAWNTERVYARP